MYASARTQTHDEEAMLVGHIQEMEKEKALLTSALPSLTRASSDDDLLSTDMDDGSLDDGADMDNEGIACCFPFPKHQPLSEALVLHFCS